MDESKEMEAESKSGECFLEQELFDWRAALFN